MKDLFAHLDEVPVTGLLALAFVTMAFLTDPFSPATADLVEYGAAVGILIMDGEPWRLLSYAVLHGGLIHLLFNGYCLLAFGPGLERRLGSVRFAVLYVAGALGGGVAGTLWHEFYVPLVGGSGALFAMFGAVLALNMRAGRHLLDFLDYHGPRTMLSLIAFNLVLGFLLPMVSNSAHMGGLAAGFVLAFCFLEPGRGGTDGLGRAIQAGWLAVLLAWTLFCVEPVHRRDYALRREVRAMSAAERAETLELLESGELRSITLPWVRARFVRWLEGG